MSLHANLRSFYPFDRMGQYTAALDHVGGRHLTSDGTAGVFPLHAEGGFAFDGNDPANSPMDVLTDSAFDFDRLGDEWTICFDFFQGGDEGTIIAKDAPLAQPNVQRSFRLLVNPAGALQLILTSEDSQSITATVPFLVNEWQRVVITRSANGLIRFRCEGNQDDSQTMTAPVRHLADVPLRFGNFEGAPTGDARFMTTGAIKNLMVWDRVVADRDRLVNERWTPNKRWEQGDEFVLTAVGGQSLVTGQSAGNPTDPENYERKTVSIASTQFNRSTLQRFHYEGRNVAGIGPEMGMIAATDTDGIVIHGRAGTSLFQDWNPTTPGPEWNAFRNQVLRVKDDLVSLGLKPSYKYMLWFQGTGDTSVPNDSNYGANLTQLAAELRTLLENPNLIIAVGHDWNDDIAFGIYGETINVIRAQKQIAVDADPLMVLVDQVNFTRVDHVHMDWGAVTYFGIEVVNQLRSVDLPTDIAPVLTRIDEAVDTLTTVNNQIFNGVAGIAALQPANRPSVNADGEIATVGGGSTHSAQDVADLVLANPANPIVTNTSGSVTTSNPSTGGTGSAHTAADVAALILANPTTPIANNTSGAVATTGGGESLTVQDISNQLERDGGPLDTTFKSGDTIQHRGLDGVVQATVIQTKV